MTVDRLKRLLVVAPQHEGLEFMVAVGLSVPQQFGTPTRSL